MTDLQNYRVGSSLFNVTLPENNIFGVPPQDVLKRYLMVHLLC